MISKLFKKWFGGEEPDEAEELRRVQAGERVLLTVSRLVAECDAKGERLIEQTRQLAEQEIELRRLRLLARWCEEMVGPERASWYETRERLEDTVERLETLAITCQESNRELRKRLRTAEQEVRRLSREVETLEHENTGRWDRESLSGREIGQV